MELDWLLEDRRASRRLVLCPETVLRHDTVTEGWDLERQKKRSDAYDNDSVCVFPVLFLEMIKFSLSPTELTERKAWTMSALIELRGLSRINTKICSSFSRLIKLPNQDLLASLKISN